MTEFLTNPLGMLAVGAFSLVIQAMISAKISSSSWNGIIGQALCVVFIAVVFGLVTDSGWVLAVALAGSAAGAWAGSYLANLHQDRVGSTPATFAPTLVDHDDVI